MASVEPIWLAFRVWPPDEVNTLVSHEFYRAYVSREVAKQDLTYLIQESWGRKDKPVFMDYKGYTTVFVKKGDRLEMFVIRIANIATEARK